VYEKSTYKSQNVILFLEAGENVKGIQYISANLCLIKVLQPSIYNVSTLVDMLKELKSINCIGRCILIQRTYSINMYDDVTEGCS
jgi:hypothetical protein